MGKNGDTNLKRVMEKGKEKEGKAKVKRKGKEKGKGKGETTKHSQTWKHTVKGGRNLLDVI